MELAKLRGLRTKKKDSIENNADRGGIFYKGKFERDCLIHETKNKM